MISLKERKAFADHALPSFESLLEDALSWIATNLSPDEVFSTAELESWAKNEGWTKEPRP